jgi:hypothetical protein
MIQIVLLVLGIIAAIRYPRLMKASVQDCPGVAPEAFAEWKSAERSAAIWLIVATIGVCMLQLAVGFGIAVAMTAMGKKPAEIREVARTLSIVSIVIFVALLIVAAACGSRAKRLKTAAGIVWPKKAAPGS